MSLTGPQNLLIDALKALPPNSLYTGVEKKTIFSGFRLYSDKRVESIAWDGDSLVLTVNVADGMLLPVAFTREDSEIVPRCVCAGHAAGGRCAHIVCALLTIIHLLKPNLFRISTENPQYRDRLLSALQGKSVSNSAKLPSPENSHGRAHLKGPRDGVLKESGAALASSFTVVIEGVRGRLKAYVERHGKRVESADGSGYVPPELEYLLGFSRRDDMSVPLSIFLRKWGCDYHISLREGNETHRIEWSGRIACTTWTEFDTSGDEVLLRKGCAIENDPEPAVLVGNFAFNAARAKMCYVKERQGWDLWNMVRDACLRGGTRPWALRT